MTTEELAKALYVIWWGNDVWDAEPESVQERWLEVAAEAKRILCPDPPEDCVRVRIAVAVSHPDMNKRTKIGVCAIDYSTNDRGAMHLAKGQSETTNHAALGFAEIDLPKIPTVQGRIVEPKSCPE
jgi:hypothetical protein